MGAKALDIRGPVSGTTAYCNGELVGRNVTIKLPPITHVLATIMTGLGEQEIPLLSMVESMEASITKVGYDLGLAKCIKLESMNFEFRWVQQVTKLNGEIANGGCRAYIRGIPKELPDTEVTVGENIELDLGIAVTRYQLFVENVEYLLVDKLAPKCVLAGVDYSERINSLL